MKSITRLRAARPEAGAHRLVHPSDPTGRWARTTPHPHAFQPRHCAGALDPSLGCLHTHPGEQTCGCGQTTLPAVVLQVRPHDTAGKSPAPFIRHSSEGCHAVSPVPA